MITPSGTKIEVYENQNRSTTILIENDTESHHGGWLWLEHDDIDYLIAELQKHKSMLNKP